MEVGSHLQNDMIPHDTVSATRDAWRAGAGITVWDWIPLLSNEAFTYECFSPHIIVQLSESESKVHVFQSIVFQANLSTSVKPHVARFRKTLVLAVNLWYT